MNILYIIGNGFDRWHNLPTSYLDFYNNNRDGLDEYSQYFSLDQKNPLWYNFEEDLGRFDWHSLYTDHDFTDPMSDNFRPSEVYGLQDALAEEAESMVGYFKDIFKEWIETIEVERAEAKFSFVSDASFLSFNYTPLLNVVYGIHNERILHLHGCVANNDSPIFGHGLDINEGPEFDDEGNRDWHMFSEAEGAAKMPLHQFKKPVNEILNHHQIYFTSLSDTKFVVVLGHSLNDIDLPYFQKVANVAPNSYWIVSQYSVDEVEHHILQLKKCGVASDRILLSSIDSIPNILAGLMGHQLY